MSEASRREVLRLLLGAPLAALGCERGLPRRKIPGEIVGGNVSLGHRLKDQVVEQARGDARRVGVVIVGAGPSGLSAAWRLERQGMTDYVVLDLEGQPGGTSAYGTSGAVPHPWGAHYVPVPTRDNPALVSLLSEMKALEGGTGEPEALEELIVRKPDERVFIDGRWHQGLFPSAGASAQDRAELRRFEAELKRWSRYRDAQGRRAFTLPMANGSDTDEVKALDRVSAADWLTEHGVRSARVRWYVEYACRDDYGLDLAHTSAWAMLFYFCSRGSGVEGTEFITWPEGNGRVVKHLVDVVGPRLSLGHLVTDVVPREDDVELAAYSAETGLTRYVADQVILALPKFVAARVVRPLRERGASYLQDFSYGSWMVANLHVTRQPKSVGFEQAWDNVIYDSPALGYVVATHQTLRDRGPSVWTYYHPFTDADPKQARERLLAADHAGLVDSILVDLRRAHPDIEEVVSRIDVWRWGHAMVRPTPGFIWGASRVRAAEPLGRVHFAHSDLSGLALLEEAQYRGIVAADAVLRQRGMEPL